MHEFIIKNIDKLVRLTNYEHKKDSKFHNNIICKEIKAINNIF